ncbi:hypothetical protein AX777_18230 [Sphingobium yanoikuyae]|uniref:Tip attachment protein J domain-containing protein n=1 Tax=Sphingobium yanoikuyae TaxID=13690 RepID=A0A177J7V3_SPHYA|nr:hypothetical protein [Sphingobium yanoikuyae]OAH36977.1 hypothetical protein AX777_18230 [Sphingobium yanoikuyae]
MSGFMRKAALVVGAVALVAATAGAAAPLLAPGMAGAAGISGVASAATLTAIGTYGGLAAGVLTAISAATAPGMSSQGSQTSFTTNPQSGLPYAMGRTRMSGLRIYAKTNTRPGYTKFNDLLWFGAMLSIGGAIGGIEKFTADNEIVTFDASGNAIGDYHDYQAQKIHLGGQQTSALALTLGGGSAPGWTTSHKLSGITHAMWCLRYNKQGEMYGAGAPEPAWIGNWVKVYDPRLDSTYPGGSGSCRALVESTYVWSDNPGLHALTWALGRWQNGKRTCGIGAPVANIRVAEFVECANVCEANGWKVGGVEWTTDSKWDTLKRILQAGGAIPTQTGAMVGCLVSTPRTAIATIESRHLLDSLSIAATKSRRDRFNSVIPRYVDEDSDWSVISGTAITVSDYVTADKGQRTKEIDYPLVQVFSGQVAKQPGQLAAYDIVNSREAGPINFTTGPEWIGLKTGDVILLNVPEEGLVNQPVLITRRAPDPSTGKVAFSAQTETYAKHAYALGQSTTPPAPFSLTAPDLKPPAPAASNWAAAGTVTGEGLPAIVVTGNSEMPSADAVLIDYKLPADATWTRSAILSANEPVQHVIAPLQSETAYQVRVGYRVEQIDGDFTILAAVTTGVGVISDISNTVGEQQDKLDQLEADTAAAEVAIAAAQAQIAEIQSSVTADFSAVNQAVDALNLDVSGVRSDITSLEQQAAGIIASIGDVGVEVAQLTTDLATANSNIGINAQAITSVSGSVAQLSSTVQAHDASIITNAQAIGALGSDLAILTTRVTAGGPNLQPNGGLENGLVGMSYVAGAGWQVGSGPKSGQSVATFIAPANGDVSIGWPLVPMEGGIEITVSANMSFSADGGVAFLLVEAFDALGAHLGWSPERHQAASFDWSADESRRALTATTWTTPAGTANIRVYFVARPVGNMTFAGASQLMVQRGPHWSAFSSEASIVQSFQALSTLDSSYASLSTTVASYDGSIATLQQSYSGLNGTLAQLSSTVQAQDASIVTLQQASSNQAGQLAQLSIDLATANSNISINAQAISTTNSNVAQLSSTVQAQGALAATNAQAISALDSNLATLTTQVRAGSQPNLVVNGSGENGLANWTFSGAGWGSTVSGSWGSIILNYSLGASEQYSVADSDIFQVWAGDLTFALETVLTNSEGVGWARGELIWLDANQNALFTSFGPSRAANHDFTQDNSGRRALTWSIQVPSGAAFARARVVFYRPSGSITVAAFRQAKVEAGAIASAYSSEASIVQSYQTLSTLSSSYASLSSTVQAQGVTISSQQTAITTIQGNVTSLFARAAMTISAGNVITGWENTTNGAVSSFRIRSDVFEVVPSTGTGERTAYSNGSWKGWDSNNVKRWQLGKQD